ncbi:MAG: T9SS type A sorting domain-containing protein [Ferruginibacter sp.]
MNTASHTFNVRISATGKDRSAKTDIWPLKNTYTIILFFLAGALFSMQGIAQTTVTINPGTTTWVCPIGVYSVSVECYGGGGAGGGATGSPSAGGGGAGGSYVKNTTITVVPGTTYNVSVGASVTGTGNTVVNGNDTWFMNSGTLLAKGGLGGNPAPSNSQTAAGALALTTGNVGNTAPFSYYGGGGGTGGGSGASGGGGGSSAGTGSNGNTAVGTAAGVAVTGGGAGVAGSSSSADGADNANVGGGGAGGRSSGTTDHIGGNGGPGQIKITYTQLTFKSQIISLTTGSSTTWCGGETRTNVIATIKNIGTATWNDVPGQDINVGLKWNSAATCPASGAWCDYHVRVDAAGLTPGSTGTYTFTITASNATGGPTYGTVLTAGSNNLICDIVYEAVSWFGDNGGGVGPGNAKFTSAAQTISNTASTLSFTSAAGTNAQTKCINTAITNITYLVGGGGTGATVSGLPAGVTGSYNSGTKVFTISGTPSVAGTFNYTVTTTGPCANPSLGGTITVNALATIGLSSAAGTDAQTKCINNAITDITYAIGGNTTGGTLSGSLPAGVTGSYDGLGTFTITGTPTASGTFNYTVTANGPCPVSLNGSITVNANSTLTFTSAAGTDAQTKCINTPITNITYLVGAGGTGATVTGLPTGVTGAYNSGTKVFTISGTATVSGSFSYTVTTTGPCINTSLGGTVDVLAASTISLTSAAGTNNQAICIGSDIVDINYVIGGTATDASLSGSLPPGVLSGYDGGGNFTITGTPTTTGTFNFTVTANGICPVSLSGTIIVNDNSTITFTSAAGTDAQTKCINTAITNITYLVGGGGTGATVTGLPTGVTGAYNSGTKVFTISGSASVSGTFNYTVTTTGPCINTSLGGTLTITGNTTISLTSGAGTNIQTRCIDNAITDITYSIGGTGTGAGVTGLPAGVTGTYSAGVFTISGTPTASGTFNYTVTPTGPCVNPTATGTITVNANSTLTFTSAVGTDAQTKCINIAITNITYLVGSGGTGAGVTGLPTGVTGAYNSGTKVFTISGTPSVAGTFNYTVTTTGPCINTSLGGSITVIANSTISLTSAVGTNIQTVCQNSNITTITYAIGGSGTSASATGLPAGVTGSYSAGVFTISGAPTTAASGAFNYTVTTSGPCVNPNLTGTITVNVIPTTTGVSICQNGSGSLTSSFVCANGSPVSTAAKNAGTGADATGIGTVTWSNPGNITTAGTPYATASIGAGATSHYLVGTNYTFGIPANATVKGVQVVINRNAGNVFGGVGDQAVYLVKAGVVQTAGNNKAGGTWPTSFGTATYGSATDLWNLTLTATDINATGFGVALAGKNNDFFTLTATVDYMQITVTYTVPGSLNWYTVSSGGSSIGSGSPFNPVGVAGSTLANTNTPGTTVFYAECSTVAGCRTPTNFVINPNSTISLSSAAGTNAQTVCINNAITDITYAIGGNGTGASITAGALPAGVTGSYSAGVFTISGTPTASGNFNYTVTTSGGGCAQASLTGTITVNPNATISLTSGAGTAAQTKCINTAITNITYAIGGSGTGASAIGLPAGVTGSYSAGVFTISGAATVTGTFNYTVTTTGPCVNNFVAGTITITPDATIGLTSAAGTDIQEVCNNTPIIPISYTIAGGGTGAGVTGLPAGVSAVFNAGVITISGTPTVAGTFNYTVTTTGTCAQVTANGTITVHATPAATFTSSNVSACGALPDGAITITASGGTGPYSYNWTGVTGSGNPATTQFPSPGNVSSVSGLKIGFYNVMVTDAFGCQVSINNIHIQYAFSAYITNNGSISSACGNTGSIILYANAGVLPYSFSLDGTNFSTNNTFTNLAAGTYTAYVKDGAGCVITKTITVNAAAQIVVSPFVRGASSCSPDGSIEIYRTGGIPPYSYSLDGTTYQASNKFVNLAAGPYTTYVKDSKGCVGTAPATVTQGTALGVTVNKTNTSTCVNDGSIQVNPTGGIPPYSYSINAGAYQANNSFSGLGASSYAISVKDFKGCLGSINVTINLNTIVVTAYVTAAGSCAGTNGSIQLFRTGGFGPYTYSLDGNTYQNSGSFTNLAPGEYDGFVKDSKTCIGGLFGIVVGPNCAPPIVGTGTNTKSANINAVKGNAVKISEKSVLKISAYPNPSAASFTLLLEAGSKEKVTVTVSDLAGRKVFQAEGNVKQQYRFGNDLVPGIYMLQVIQGNEKQTIKLVKE